MLGRLKKPLLPSVAYRLRQVPSDNGNSYSSSKVLFFLEIEEGIHLMLVLSSSRINTRLFSTSHFLSCRHPCDLGQVHYLLFRDAVGMAVDRWSGEWQSFARN